MGGRERGSEGREGGWEGARDKRRPSEGSPSASQTPLILWHDMLIYQVCHMRVSASPLKPRTATVHQRCGG